ncbi:MAG TPA: hypothetical protein VMV00_01165 [Candidatus Baltobacteraceae bacterium]|nr:hypothetical protein [Candidatus Baltobacteraceae bacterium]
MNAAAKQAPRSKRLQNAWEKFIPEASLISNGNMALNIQFDSSIGVPPAISYLTNKYGKQMEADGIRDGKGFVGVVNYAVNGKNVDLICRPVTYFEHRSTDLSFIKGPLSEEHAIWVGAQAKKSDSNGFIPSFSNLLGMDVLVVCKSDDGKGELAVFQVRSNKVIARHGMLMGSASGGLTLGDASLLSEESMVALSRLQGDMEDGKRHNNKITSRPSTDHAINIYNTCASELQQELNLKAEELTSLKLRGYIHNKSESDPDALFVATTDLTESEIRAKSASGVDNYEYDRLLFEEFPISGSRLHEIRDNMSPQSRSVYFLSLLRIYGEDGGLDIMEQHLS